MLESKYTCDTCGAIQTVRQLTTNPDDVPPRWAHLRVQKGGSSASQSESMHICPSCVNTLTERKGMLPT